MKKRSWIAFLLAAVLWTAALTGPAALPAAAADDLAFTVGSATGKAGETVSLPIRVSSQISVDALLLYGFTYDTSKLEFKGFTDYGELITRSLTRDASVDSQKVQILLGYSPALRPDGIICHASFRIKEGTANGDVPVSFTGQYSIDRVAAPVTVTAGTVTVSNPVSPVKNAVFTLGTASGKAGDTVALPLSVTADGSVDAIQLSGFTYDTARLEFEGFSGTSELLTRSLAGSGSLSSANQTILLNYASPLQPDGLICYVNFGIKTGTADGTVSVSCTGSVSSGGTRTAGTAIPGTVTVSNPVSGAKKINVTFGTASGKAGEMVNVPISVRADGPVDVVQLYQFTYDSTRLEFIGFTGYTELITGSVAGAASVNDRTPGIQLAYLPALKPDGMICSACFRIKTGAADGKAAVSCTALGTFNQTAIPVTLTAGSVTVQNPVSAAKKITFSLGTAAGKAGEIVNLPVSVTADGPVDALQLYGFTFDSTGLEFVGFVSPAALVSRSRDGSSSLNNGARTILLNYAAPLTPGGTICYAAFRIKAGAANGSFIVSCTGGGSCGSTGIPTTVNTGTVTVNNPAPVNRKVTFTLGNVEGAAGDTVKIPISVKTDGAVTALQLFSFTYDKTRLEFTGFSGGTELVNRSVNKAASLNGATGTVLLSYAPALTPDGLICYAGFRIKDGTKDGTVTVSCTVNASANGNAAAATVTPATVTVTNTLPGDGNGDGKVNGKDLILLRRFIADGSGSTPLLISADMNGDMIINGKDLILLRRFIADQT